LVQEGSVVREPQGLTVRFVVTDTAHTVPVSYTGLLPDLFNEGKGVVAQGRLGTDGVFRADQVLAKTPLVMQLHRRVASLPKVAAYLRSERRIAFNEQGIFRRYPELDIA
jgi:hypothetical protein